MEIAPKLGEFDFDEDLSRFGPISSKVEIQMLSKDLNKSLSNCMTVLDNIREGHYIDEIVLHMPFSKHTFELFLASGSLEKTLGDLLYDVEYYADKYNIKIWLLFHQENNFEVIESVNGIEAIRNVLNKISSDNVGVLVENCLPCLNSKDSRSLDSFELVSRVSHPKMHACFDICHAKCYEHIFDCKYPMTTEQAKYVKWIHFSDTYNDDGFRDMRTHSRVHTSTERAISDIEYVESFGIDIDIVPVCTEITEKDFRCKPDMCEEIRILASVSIMMLVDEGVLSP